MKSVFFVLFCFYFLGGSCIFIISASIVNNFDLFDAKDKN